MADRVRIVMPYHSGYLLESMDDPAYPVSLGKVRFPGGGMKDGESIRATAVRELNEEFGIVVDPDRFRYLGTVEFPAWDCREHYLLLRDPGIGPASYLDRDSGKSIRLVWGSSTGGSWWYGPDVGHLLATIDA